MEYVEAIREHAVNNYEKDGWDFLVECWEDSDIAECIADSPNLQVAISKCERVVKQLNEDRASVQNEDY